MNNRQKNKKWFFIVVVAILLAEFGLTSYSFGLANPAAVYCVKLGYKYIMKEQRGFCQFPDGSSVDAWKFFTGEEGKKYSYCRKYGYGIKTVQDKECKYTRKCAVCILRDGTEKKVTSLIDVEKKPSEPLWNSKKFPVNSLTVSPEHKTNFLLYLIAGGVMVGLAIVAFVIYRKVKEEENY